MDFNFAYFFIFLAVALWGLLWKQSSIDKGYLILFINISFLFFVVSMKSLPLLAFVILTYFLCFYLLKKSNQTRVVGSILFVAFCIFLFLLPRSQNSGEQILIRPLFYSYVVLHCLSHFIETLFKNRPPLKWVDYLNSCLFFPSIQSGPIQIPHALSEKIQKANITWDGSKAGLFLIVNGLFKKRLADAAADAMTVLATDPKSSSSTMWLIGLLTLARTYGDFSGYTDVALGSARMLGIQLHPNFQLPYFSSSLADFWRRWHMSLSHWARIYIFNPLYIHLKRTTYEKSPILNQIVAFIAIWITFVFIGLWHEISWRFFIWGSLNAIAVWLSTLHFISANRLKFIKIPLTLFLIMIFQIIAHSQISMADLPVALKSLFFFGENNISYSSGAVLISLMLLCLPHFLDWLFLENKLSPQIRFLVLIAQLLILSVVNVSSTPFIYGQF